MIFHFLPSLPTAYLLRGQILNNNTKIYSKFSSLFSKKYIIHCYSKDGGMVSNVNNIWPLSQSLSNNKPTNQPTQVMEVSNNEDFLRTRAYRVLNITRL